MSKLSDQTGPSPNMAASTSDQVAAHAVFNTNELLCNIIGRMSMRDIALATNVCRAWSDSLKADNAIQRVLWRAPTGIQEIETSYKLDCLGMRS